MAEQKVKLTDLPAATDTIDTAQLLVNQNGTDQKLPITHLLRAKNNLSDLADSDQARANLNVPSVDEVNDKLAGYIAGKYTFLAGGSLVSRNDFIWDEGSQSWYYWTGALPKDVPAASTPESTGGVGPGAWIGVGDATLRSMLAAPGGDKMIGSSYGGGSVWDDYAAKENVFPLTNIYPSMSNAEINTILAAGGSVYFNEGDYIVTTADDTFKLNQNLRVMSHPRAILKAGGNGVTVLRASSQDIGTTVRNFKLFGVRIELGGFNNCIGFHGYDVRNNSLVTDMWIDMKLGTNCTGLLVEHYSYGMRLDNVEILNGGTGSTRRMLRNGANAITLKDHIGYSADLAGALPDYDTVIFNGLNGDFNFPAGQDLWPTAAVNIVGGFFQNTAKYGLLDSGVSTYISGAYFERNGVSDIALAAGSYYFSSGPLHFSLNIGESQWRISGANHFDIGQFNPADRSIGAFNALSGNNGKADGGKIWGAFLDKLGVVAGLRLDLGIGSFKQYDAASLPIKIREGFRSYRMNVTTGLNITVAGTPFDGQEINVVVRGSNIAALSFAGVPVDVTGANTAINKTAQFTATYWGGSVNKWTLSMPSWTASA